MARYIWYEGHWVRAAKRAYAPIAPAIIRDTMDALLHPATGEMFDSKSAFRLATKEAGYVELGNDQVTPAPYRPDPTIERDVAEAYAMVEQGYHVAPTESISSGDFAGVPTRIIEG